MTNQLLIQESTNEFIFRNCQVVSLDPIDFTMILALKQLLCDVCDESLHSNVVALSCCQLSPAILLLPLPHFGDDKGKNEQAEDDSYHADCEGQTERPIYSVFTELSSVSQRALTQQLCATSWRRHTCPMTITLILSTGGQAVVDASGLRSNRSSRSGHV